MIQLDKKIAVNRSEECRVFLVKEILKGIKLQKPKVYNNLGIVLSSGGMWGLAQLGGLQALIEAGILPGYIGAASAGALMGALFCVDNGKTLNKKIDYIGSLRARDFVDFSYFNGEARFKGIMSGDKIIGHVREMIGNPAFSQLKTKLGIAASEYAMTPNGNKFLRPKFFTEGNVLQAVRASIAAPNVIKPSKIGEWWYQDGGLVSPVPVTDVINWMKKDGIENPIILGIDVGYRMDPSEKALPVEPSRQDIKDLWHAAMEEKIAAMELALCNYVLRPVLGMRELSQFDAIFKIKPYTFMQIGYLNAKKNLDFHKLINHLEHEKRESSGRLIAK